MLQPTEKCCHSLVYPIKTESIQLKIIKGSNFIYEISVLQERNILIIIALPNFGFLYITFENE